MTFIPSITVVICARNAEQHLRTSIPAAFAQDYPRERFKVLVVDNGSTDRTAAVARELGATVRKFLKPGVAGARQFGWKQTKSDFVAYLDADCDPPANWLSSLVAHFASGAGVPPAQLAADRSAVHLASGTGVSPAQKPSGEGARPPQDVGLPFPIPHSPFPNLAAVGVRLVSDTPRTLSEKHIEAAHILDTDRWHQRNALQFPFVATAGLMVRRSALEEIGGFDTTFGRATGEDADLCWRLERAGYEVRYDRSVEIIHHHRATLGAMLRQVHWYGAGSAAIFARWREALGWRRYTDWNVYTRLFSGLIHTLPAMIFKTGYERWAPLLQVLDAAAFLCGKWKQAGKEGVMFL